MQGPLYIFFWNLYLTRPYTCIEERVPETSLYKDVKTYNKVLGLAFRKKLSLEIQLNMLKLINHFGYKPIFDKEKKILSSFVDLTFF